MTEPDTSILDELRRRTRRAALRERGAATGRVRREVSAPRPTKRARPAPAPKPKTNGQPGFKDARTQEKALASRMASAEERRQREGDDIAEAVLGILQRLAQTRPST